VVLLISWVGVAGCFALNAATFLALIFNLKRMNLPRSEPNKRVAGLGEIREGYAFVREHPILWPTTVLVAVCSLFALSFSNLLPVFAKDVFHSDAQGFLSSAHIFSVRSACFRRAHWRFRVECATKASGFWEERWRFARALQDLHSHPI
jgi:hypothetical protein